MTTHTVGPSTLCIHANPQKDAFGSIIPPIYQTSTFVFDDADQGTRRFSGKEPGFVYTRIGNPTVAALEGKLAALENTEAAVATSSGMGAIGSMCISLLKSGDHIVSDDTLYGATQVVFARHIAKFGVTCTFVDASVPDAVKNAIKPNTRLVYFETPANPTLKVIDIRRVVEEASVNKDAIICVDNTFASPLVQSPIALGVHLVVHSMTKYINGHTDVVGGCVCGQRVLIDQIRKIGVKDFTGAIISPHDAWLVMRGMMTLACRVQKAAENSMVIARFLEGHDKVERVFYPGLESHPQHEIAKKQMKNFGSMVAFELKGGLEAGKSLLNKMKVISLAVSLGGCESLIQHPASMTHACVPKEEREAGGITDGLIRLGVGIEDIEDLLEDLKQGLQ